MSHLRKYGRLTTFSVRLSRSNQGRAISVVTDGVPIHPGPHYAIDTLKDHREVITLYLTANMMRGDIVEVSIGNEWWAIETFGRYPMYKTSRTIANANPSKPIGKVGEERDDGTAPIVFDPAVVSLCPACGASMETALRHPDDGRYWTCLNCKKDLLRKPLPLEETTECVECGGTGEWENPANGHVSPCSYGCGGKG